MKEQTKNVFIQGPKVSMQCNKAKIPIKYINI